MWMNGLMGAVSMGAMSTDNRAIVLPTESRRQLGPVASRKDKKKRDRRAYHASRIRSRRTAPLGTSNPFTFEGRRAAFHAAMAAGQTRNAAMKIARRVAA